MPTVPPIHRRVAAGLLAAAALCVPAPALAQTSTIPEDGAGVSTTPPVPLTDPDKGSGSPTSRPSAADQLPDTGSDPRMVLMAGLALTLLGFGLRLRTADVDDY